MAYQL